MPSAGRSANDSGGGNSNGTAEGDPRFRVVSNDGERWSDGSDDADPASNEDALTESDLAILNAVLGHDIADNTKRTYQSQWRRFVEWARAKRLRAMPADPMHVAVYLAERIEVLGHKPATLRAAAASISFAHRASNCDDPCDSHEVKEALKSATRKVGREQKQAQALTEDCLMQIRATALRPRRRRNGRYESREAANQRGTADIAIISLMRDAMLRVSEAAALRWEDLRVEGDGTGRLLIRRSKTDSDGETAVLFVSRPTMVALERMSRCAPERWSVFGLSSNQLSRRIKEAARAADLGDGFSGHSPRVGMAQDLARAGTELPRLMSAGRWRSPRMPAHYIRNETAARGAVAQYYGFSADDEPLVKVDKTGSFGRLESLTETANVSNIVADVSESAGNPSGSAITGIIGSSSFSSTSSVESPAGKTKTDDQSRRLRRNENSLKRKLILSKSDALSLARRVWKSQPVDRLSFGRKGSALRRLPIERDDAFNAIAKRPAVGFLLFRALPLALAVILIGFGLSFLDWERPWVPAVYISLSIALVMTHGLAFRDAEGGLREFFWGSVFFVLSTPMLHFAPIGTDPYGFNSIGGFASTHIPYMLALLANLVIAASSGLMFHVLRLKFSSRADDGDISLKQACVTTLLPLGFVYAVVAVISNASLWIQLGLLIPSLAVAFTVLLALFDRSIEYQEKDRQFLLFATFTSIAICLVVGIATIFVFYMLPWVSQVIPDYNLLRSWEIDFASTGSTREDAIRLLRMGFLLQATITFVYMIVVVGGNVLVAVFHMGSGGTSRRTQAHAAAASATNADRATDGQPKTDDRSAKRSDMPLKFAGANAATA